MTTKNRNEFPAGWDQHRVQDVLEYYENQTDEEAAAEHEVALSGPGRTVMEVPRKLVPVFRQLIAQHRKEQTSS